MPLSTNVQTKTNYLLMLSKVNFFPVIAGNGKTQILVTFSATISFNLFPCWRKKLGMNSTELVCDNFKPLRGSFVIETRKFFDNKCFLLKWPFLKA